MSDPGLLSAFIDAWNAGERPDVDEYLVRAAADARGSLAAEIAAFLAIAPAPEYSGQTLDELLADPQVRALARMPSELGLWPAALPRLRRQARLRRDELVRRLAAKLGVAGCEAKVGRYYHQMETGTLKPAGVSRRVLDALASILGASTDELVEAGELRGFASPPAQGAFGRAYGTEDHIDTGAETLGQIDAEEEWDEVDELFRGGR